jgi:hypothetical protein
LQELLDKVRSVTEADSNLQVFSYSKMEVFKNCPMQYKFKYIEKKYTNDTSIALELGSLCHAILERKGKMIANGETVDYERLNDWLHNGIHELDAKTREELLGVDALKKKYFEIWFVPDNASGMSYKEKMDVFDKVLHEEMEDTEWIPTYFEMPFEFVWDNKVILKWFIDRIDVNGNLFRTVDYKTSKKIYEQNKLSTSLQFGIYALAILNQFGVLPEESEYRFILLDEAQYALTKGWEKRLIKALDKTFTEIETSEKDGKFVPKPTPLCYFCNFCRNNPDANDFQYDCEYFSLWQPNKKSFEVNKKWNALETVSTTTKRKLVF